MAMESSIISYSEYQYAKYKHIEFVHIEDKPKTSVWSCRNIKSGDELGQVLWYPAWRQYVYVPARQGVYNIDCLNDISDFINIQMENRK